MAVGRREHAWVDVDVRGGGGARSRRRERDRRRGRYGIEGVRGEEDEGKTGRGHGDRACVGRLITVNGRHV